MEMRWIGMSENEIWAAVCISLAGIFCLLGIVFAVSREKGAMLVSGFNTLPEQEREQYDRKRISLDMRNSLFLWSGILAAGARYAPCSFIGGWQRPPFLSGSYCFSGMYILTRIKRLKNTGNEMTGCKLV